MHQANKPVFDWFQWQVHAVDLVSLLPELLYGKLLPNKHIQQKSLNIIIQYINHMIKQTGDGQLMPTLYISYQN